MPTNAPDQYWDFNATGSHAVEAMNVQLSYTTASGNFLGDNGDDLYLTGSQSLFWDHYTDAGGLHKRDIIVGGLSARSNDDQLVYTVQDDVIIDPED